MKPISVLAAIVLLSACVHEPDTRVTDAVADYIQVAELSPADSMRTRNDYHYTIVSERYVIVKTRRAYSLVEFARDCRELDELHRVSPDFRHDPNVLRARFDTIRGCRIAKLYPIEKWQAEELENLGDAPGD